MEPGIYKIIWRVNDSRLWSPWWNPNMEKYIWEYIAIWIDTPNYIQGTLASEGESGYSPSILIHKYFRRDTWLQKIASVSQT